MRFKPPGWPFTGKVLGLCLTVVGITLLYRLGFADFGGVMILSAIIVSVIALVRSGALSAAWLLSQSPQTIRNAARMEFAKAMICAGIGIDAFRALAAGVRQGALPAGVVTAAIVLCVAVLSAMGTGLFLTRAFAAYLFVKRR